MKEKDKKQIRKLIFVVRLFLISFFLIACSGSEVSAKPDAPEEPLADSEPVSSSLYEAPEFEDSVFDESACEGNDTVKIDFSHLSEGYLGISVNEDARIKFQVIKDEETYTYDVSSEGKVSFFPIQSGNGTYLFRVMKNVVDKKYAEVYKAEKDVQLKDEFQPFIRPSDYVNYNRNSKCVKKAEELAKKSANANEVISGVYEFICKQVKYDVPKAENIQSGYLPVPDETMETGKGICFDYASLAASMLRSQGIPTKVIFGYVSPNDIYHAWNMFYTKETGWVTVEMKVSADTWTRLDLTFSANGSDSSFIGNGDNYTDVFEY